MSNQLFSIVNFIAVAAGASVSLPHGLNEGQTPLIPDELKRRSIGEFTVTADALNVTVTNNGPGAANIDVLCERWHSVERELGVVGGEANLSIQPWESLNPDSTDEFAPRTGIVFSQDNPLGNHKNVYVDFASALVGLAQMQSMGPKQLLLDPTHADPVFPAGLAPMDNVVLSDVPSGLAFPRAIFEDGSCLPNLLSIDFVHHGWALRNENVLGVSGVPTAALSFAAGVVTLEDANGPFGAVNSLVGRCIVITNSVAGNNGVFAITANTANTVSWSNPAGADEAIGGLRYSESPGLVPIANQLNVPTFGRADAGVTQIYQDAGLETAPFFSVLNSNLFWKVGGFTNFGRNRASVGASIPAAAPTLHIDEDSSVELFFEAGGLGRNSLSGKGLLGTNILLSPMNQSYGLDSQPLFEGTIFTPRNYDSDRRQVNGSVAVSPSGTPTEAIAVAAGIVTITDAAATDFGSDNSKVGRKVIISGATSPANNGTFTITANTEFTFSYANAAGVAEAAGATEYLMAAPTPYWGEHVRTDTSNGPFLIELPTARNRTEEGIEVKDTEGNAGAHNITVLGYSAEVAPLSFTATEILGFIPTGLGLDPRDTVTIAGSTSNNGDQVIKRLIDTGVAATSGFEVVSGAMNPEAALPATLVTYEDTMDGSNLQTVAVDFDILRLRIVKNAGDMSIV